jgi:hypothetical protein
MDLGGLLAGELKRLFGVCFVAGSLCDGECRVEAVEFKAEAWGWRLRVPLNHGSAFDCGGFELFDGVWGGAGGGEGRSGQGGGATGGVFDANAVGEELDRIGCQRSGEGLGGAAGAGVHGDPEDRDAGRGGCGRWGFAADLGGEGTFQIDGVRGAGWGGPVEEDLVSDAFGGEIGYGFGKIERWRPRWAGAGASNGKGCHCSCEAGSQPDAGTGRRELERLGQGCFQLPKIAAGGHPSQASILG